MNNYEKIVKFKDHYTYQLWDSELEAKLFCDRYEAIEKANEMWNEGYTLKEINNKYNIFKDISTFDKTKYFSDSLPEKFYNLTKSNHGFVISHWQCSKKPVYSIRIFKSNGLNAAKVYVSGNGGWSDYGDNLQIDGGIVEQELVMLDTSIETERRK